jgi:hypothetical protein
MPYMRRHRKGYTMKKVNGIKVDEVTYRVPNNGLPRFVKEAAAERGFGDSLEPLSLFVTEADIDAAFACAAQGDGASCVMAQAGQRLGAQSVYFYRTTAWIDFGTGPILRFKTSRAVYNNVIDPFDKGDRDAVSPGVYPLTPPSDSHSLKRRRDYQKSGRKGEGVNKSRRPVAHTERVVMASQSK